MIIVSHLIYDEREAHLNFVFLYSQHNDFEFVPYYEYLLANF